MKLADLKEKEKLADGWFVCVDKSGNRISKSPRPFAFCPQCPDMAKCGTYTVFEDALALAEKYWASQDEKSRDQFDEFILKMKVEPEAGKEEAPPSDPEKITAKKPRKPRSDIGIPKPRKTKTQPEPAESEKNSEPAQAPAETTTTVVDESQPEAYVVVPLSVDNTGIQNNIVTSDKLEELVQKLDESGVDYSVFQLGKDIKKKSKYDYLVVPTTQETPIMIKKEDLLNAIDRFEDSKIPIRIFELGKEIKYKKQIVFENA